MSLWIPITVAAALFQTLRFMMQRQLAVKELTPVGATFARFLYSAPLVVLILWIYLRLGHVALPTLTPLFWIYGAIGGLAQILATIAVVALFKSRNFAVGVTFKKTEALQVVLVGVLVLGEGVSLPGLGAIVLGVFGVVLLSSAPGTNGWQWKNMFNRAAGLGLGSGFLFAISSVCYRGASLELALDDPLARAGITLAAVTSMQLLSMALWLMWRDKPQLSAVWHSRRRAVWIGLLSMAGSFCWFTAFTLQTAAYVKALGQIELVMSLVASTLVFNERVAAREMLGIGIVVASIVLLLLAL